MSDSVYNNKIECFFLTKSDSITRLLTDEHTQSDVQQKRTRTLDNQLNTDARTHTHTHTHTLTHEHAKKSAGLYAYILADSAIASSVKNACSKLSKMMHATSQLV